MLSEEALTLIGQFGAAGLIGLLWLIERRASMHRERQLDETHRELLKREQHVEVLIGVVKDNTRAITALEQGQQRLVTVLDRAAMAGDASTHAARARS